LYQFVWHELCDWYLEAAKPDLYGKNGEDRKEKTKQVLWHVLRNTLILLHPIVPFVTEEIWHALPGTQGPVMRTSFDGAGTDRNPEAESRMGLVIDVVTGIRNVRGEMNISPSKTLDVVVHAADEILRQNLAVHQDMIVNLARLSSFAIAASGEKSRHAATAVVGDAVIYVLLEGVIDFAAELARIEKELARVDKELDGVSKKLSNSGFLAKAPAQVVDAVRATAAELTEKQAKLKAARERIRAFV
ncbi:MAG: class I tRNA ligase family protein, partial [Thermodesulfobacteriota bacterium]